MIRGRLFGVSMLVATATVAGCGSRDDVKSDVAVAPTSGSPLTAAQVQAARNAGLLNSYIRPEFYEPMANFPFAGPNDTSVFTQANRINNAGVVVGTTNRDSNGIGGSASSPYFVDAAGHQTLLPNSWGPGGPTYLVDVNERGDMIGYGGPGGPNDGDFKRPVVFHLDRSYDILHMPAPVWTAPASMWVAAIGDDGSPGSPTIAGTAATIYAGAFAVWHFDNDATDAIGPSELPTTGLQFTEGHTHRPDSPVPDAPGDAAAYFDGGTCVSIPPGQDTSPWSSPGLTLMAWVKPDAGSCPGPSRAVVRRSDDWGFGYSAGEISLACNADGTAALAGHLLAGAAAGSTPPAGHIPLGQWTHVAITSDTMHTRSYVDGTLVAEVPNDGAYPPGPFGLAVGCRPGNPSWNFQGAIDEVSMFGNALAADQIRLFKQEKTSYPRAGWVYGAARLQGGFFDLVPPPGDPGYDPSIVISARSEAGHLVGSLYFHGAATPAIYDPAVGWTNLNDLVTDPEWDLRTAGRMNAAGQILVSGEHGPRHAMGRMDLATGAVVDLGHDTNGFYADPSLYILPGDINAAGHVVGTVYDSWPYWPHRAVFYDDQSGLTDLNDLLAPDLVAAGWVLQQANGINDRDDVVGYAVNSITGVWRAFKVRVPTLPSPNSIAVASCVGKADGAACDIPDTCGGHNNVCNAGICGGDLGGICLRADGVVDMGGGNLIAVFGHDSSAGTSVYPDPNRVLINGTAIANPQPAPPTWLSPGSHPGSYLPTFVNGQTISWRVEGQMVTVSASSPHLATTPVGETGLGVPVGGKVIIIRPDLAKYARAPDEPSVSPEPAIGRDFSGALSGALTVGPTGAAIYTLPIAIPPGIAGIAPALSLVYNSQGGDGVAGQGWELTGLSMIYRCPRTPAQDGHGRPVVMDPLVPSDGGEGDGVCLDGQRLFEIPGQPGKYQPERKDSSQITRIAGGAFEVVTKSGETRHYGLKVTSRVTVSQGSYDPINRPPSGSEIAVWALDHVSDTWGNYYDVVYNEERMDFLQKGIEVSKIRYTGHFAPGALGPDVQPFLSVDFTYEDRPDVRHSRFGSVTIPRARRIKRIATSRGTYTLDYLPDEVLLPSRLLNIIYCGFDSCLDTMTFDWDWGTYGWQEVPGYAPPKSIDGWFPQGADGNIAPPGSQFVDLNGDGRLDFVFAREGQPIQAWENTGKGFSRKDDWKPPGMLVTAQGRPVGLFVDLDGDGLVDFVNDTFAPGHNGIASARQNSILTGHGFNFGSVVGLPTGQLSLDGDPTISQWHGINFLTDTFADMNGDGRIDVVGLTPGSFPLRVSFDTTNSPFNWREPIDGNTNGTPTSRFVLPDGFNLADYNLQDINRDGLPDLVKTKADASLTYDVMLNTGDPSKGDVIQVRKGQRGGPFFAATAWKHAVFRADPGANLVEGKRAIGDVDGDGLHDVVIYFDTSVFPARHWVSFSTGVGYTSDKSEPYTAVLRAFTPFQGPSTPNADFAFALADLNADGLVDVVRNHTVGGGQLLVNTGATWKDLNGKDRWETAAGPNGVPAVPGAALGVTFIDLNGDGVPDVVQASDLGAFPAPSKAWLNTFRPPVIKRFPNGVAAKSDVSYAVITTAEAREQGIYQDSETVAAGTSRLAIPLRVVSSVAVDSGLGFGSMATSKYKYFSLRTSRSGRGPQGFAAIEVTDPAGTVTTSEYAQAYPYTGRVTRVTKNNHGLVSQTTNEYCDRIPADGESCTPISGRELPPQTSLFIYPSRVTDSGNIGESAETLIITTDFRYDKLGNPTRTTITTTLNPNDGNADHVEQNQTETSNLYGDPGSVEQLLGKVTKSIVRTQKTVSVDGHNDPILHVTAYEYQQFGVNAGLVLSKKKIEPGSGAPIEHHTAFSYDRFGNVITTTVCASDFDNCSPGAGGPANLPFRTTRVSYDPNDLNLTPAEIEALEYGLGRFPAKTTNPAGHVAFTVYDPLLGTVVRQTDPNGIHTCYRYDEFGFQFEQIARCGSERPLSTTVHRHLATPFDPYPSAIVTVTRTPTGGATFVYTDPLGRPMQTLTRSFAGGFAKSETSYDDLGRVNLQVKPFLIKDGSGEPAYTIFPSYDQFGRVKNVHQELAQTNDLGEFMASNVATVYQGSTVVTEKTVSREFRQRFEKKNAIGKIASVKDANGGLMSYVYDADGNLIDTFDDAGHNVHTEYDIRGRKVLTRDPDMGTWTYAYNGFGDLAGQTDAKGVTTVMTYDQLGRMRTRASQKKKDNDSDMAQWVYDVVPGGIGRLAAMVSAPDPRLAAPCTVPLTTLTGGNRAGKSLRYTALGELEEETECVDGQTFTTSYEYDRFGRQAVVTYPEVKGTHLAVRYNYTSLGFLHFVSDAADGKVYWAVTAMNAAGQITAEYTRNGVETLSDRNPSTGWLQGRTSTSRADGDALIQAWTYRYDEAGNLRSRLRSVGSLPAQEIFDYDALDRLSFSRSGIPGAPLDTFTFEGYGYDKLGNITRKGNSTYSYTGCASPAGPHAVCNVGAGAPFAYDANGNMATGNDRTLVYDSGNKAIEIRSATGVVQLVYGADRNRVLQEVTNEAGVAARTIYVGLGDTGKSLYEKTTRPGSVEHVHFIYAGAAHLGSAFAMRVVTENGSPAPSVATKYYHTDHLGSIAAVSDDSGRVPDAGSPTAGTTTYDPWGARRAPGPGLETGRRGFTGHEIIPGLELVNMNGRMYDPALGRFLSPDPNVQFAADLQSYNRYSYVLNNPLGHTDPTGYFLDHGFDLFVNLALFTTSVVVCTGPQAAACTAAFILAATVYNSTSAIVAGAPWDQVIGAQMTGLVLGFGSGYLGGAIGEGLNIGITGYVLGGAIGGTISGAMMMVTQGGDLGTNVLSGAAEGAASAALGFALKGSKGVTQATAPESDGRDASGERTLEVSEQQHVNRRYFAANDGGVEDARSDAPLYGVGTPPSQECIDLRDDIMRRRDSLIARMVELREDKWTLPNNGPMSIETHHNNFRQEQIGLRRQLNRFQDLKCDEVLAVPERAWRMATMPVPWPHPKRDMGLFPSPENPSSFPAYQPSQAVPVVVVAVAAIIYFFIEFGPLAAAAL